MSPEDLMRNNLIAIAQRYADARGWSLATVSKEIHGNQAFFAQYLAGRMSPRLDTYFAMIEKFRARWPRGAKWPSTAPIPKLGKNVPERRAAA